MYQVTRFTGMCDPATIEIDDCSFRTDPDTGELIEQVSINVDIGSVILSPAEVQKKNAAHQRQLDGLNQKNKLEAEKMIIRSKRPFLHFDVLSDYQRLDANEVARLFFLSTYMAGGSKMGEGQLYRTERSIMVKSDIPNLLGVSRQTCGRFLDDVRGFITVHEDKTLSVNTDIFKRGKLPHSYMELQRLFVREYRGLFQSLPKNLHRVIGAVLKLAPHVNTNYNVVCENPEETDIELVKPIPFKKACALMDIDPKESSKFLKELQKIVLPLGVDGQGEPFCLLSKFGTADHKSGLFINPSIMFKGEYPASAKKAGGFVVDSRAMRR